MFFFLKNKLVRGTQLLNQLTENLSLDAILNDLIAKVADSSASGNLTEDNFALYLSLFTAQRTALFDEKERLRYVH